MKYRSILRAEARYPNQTERERKRETETEREREREREREMIDGRNEREKEIGRRRDEGTDFWLLEAADDATFEIQNSSTIAKDILVGL